MKYNELVITRQTKPHRKGRGISGGRGKTAGRGTKGQGARKSPLRFGFEGGQNPLYARLPKLRGFKSKSQPPEEVYTRQLESLSKQTVDVNSLHEAGLITSPYVNVKLIVRGELTKKKDVKLPSASANAIAILEKTGGSFTPTVRLMRPAKPTDQTAKNGK